jgi:predicted DsbA family dithiol-disulfide isomerase/tRNA-binding EMAP/Myf-like protein
MTVLISSRRLRKLVEGLPPDTDRLIDLLRHAGLRVEQVTPLDELLRGIIVGRVVELQSHPNADRLRICTVDTGEDQTLQIVTGAENVREGGIYPVIRSGSVLPNGTRIKRGKLRGELSEGMLGSADELELGDDHEGLLQLEDEIHPGTALPDAIPVSGVMIRIDASDDDEVVSALRASSASHSDSAPGGHAPVGGAAEAPTGSELQIDLFADIACPWCYIGEHRLANALDGKPGIEVVWRWRPFQLQPQLPPEGIDWEEFAAARFGADAEPMFTHVQNIGSEAGLEFNFDRISHAVNTTDAHRLILHAQATGRAREIAEALFRAYLTEGRNIGDREILVSIAADGGMDVDETRAYLESEAGIAAVQESQDTAARLGISGVPFYIFNGKVAISGAQDRETFARAITMAMSDEG